MKRFLQNNYIKILRFLPALLMMTFIFVQSAMPADVSQQESSIFADLLVKWLHLNPDMASFIVRKCAHATEYLILGLCLMFFTDGFVMPERSSFGMYFLKRSLPAWLCGTVYALSDEIHQRFVPERSCEFRDICIDSAGILAGVLVFTAIRALRKRKIKSKP